LDLLASEKGGFCFDNYQRNQYLGRSGVKFPTARKTGTTICGMVVKDAVVLGADTRATEDTIVADKNSDKLHKISSNIYCAGAGTAADLDHTTALIASNIELHRLHTNTAPRVATAVALLSQMLYKYQGHIGCNLVLGGVDVKGPQLYKIHPHGSTDFVPFDTMGSGSLAALAVLESGYKDNMTIIEGKALVAEAIRSGIFNDLGSGSNVDIVVIEKDKTEHFRAYDSPNPRLFRMPKAVTFQSGTSRYHREKVEAIRPLVTVEDVDMDAGNLDM